MSVNDPENDPSGSTQQFRAFAQVADRSRGRSGGRGLAIGLVVAVIVIAAVALALMFLIAP